MPLCGHTRAFICRRVRSTTTRQALCRAWRKTLGPCPRGAFSADASTDPRLRPFLPTSPGSPVFATSAPQSCIFCLQGLPGRDPVWFPLCELQGEPGPWPSFPFCFRQGPSATGHLQQAVPLVLSLSPALASWSQAASFHQRSLSPQLQPNSFLSPPS